MVWEWAMCQGVESAPSRVWKGSRSTGREGSREGERESESGCGEASAPPRLCVWGRADPGAAFNEFKHGVGESAQAGTGSEGNRCQAELGVGMGEGLGSCRGLSERAEGESAPSRQIRGQGRLDRKGLGRLGENEQVEGLQCTMA